MLARYPKAFENIPAVQLHHAGKSIVAWFRQADEPGREEGFLTENTLVFILRGTKHIHLADGDLIAHAGDLVLLKRGVYFMTDFITGGADYQSLLLCMDDALLRSFLPEDDDNRKTPSPGSAGPMVVTCENAVLEIRNAILRYLEQPGHHTTKLLELKIHEVLLLLLSGPLQERVQAFLQQMFDSSAENISTIIRDNLVQPFTLEEYAKMCGLSLSTFKREFSKLYNAPPKKWINEERLKHARHLLLQSGKNVNEIAWECGFENVSYFIKQYRQQYGTTPKNAQRTKNAIF
ncbi:helix-turn-helix domain-containing protein [Chitinophaga arvensicola]|uniref:AraC-type transcriptional regulator N-terminus n=1 Tax=Chitinophaga arvensicola TaxID=29529 RepID=A0A1I0SC04_9BACT|nr:AraC family transcriptional regulator [Chitinophaga arvensicola]SEW54412.1 AraC-type transcriptional regulator N-terminus [Chitinophaga arvensicola]